MDAVALSEPAILIFDDNKQERALIVRVLHALGVTHIREAGARKEAISHLGRSKADIVLCDFTLDQSECVIFARWVRTAPESTNPFVPLVVMLAKPSVQEVKDALDASINEILIKPVSVKALGDRMRAVLENLRDFIRTDAYVGPDRRRRDRPDFQGPERRRRRH